MKIFGYTILKTLELNELIVNSVKVKTENINLKHMNEVLEKEKIALIVLLDQAEQSVRMLK